MSKYYKAEDVIRAIAEQLCWEARTEYGDKFTTEDWIEEAEDYVSDLPTIEANEDCISREYMLSLLDGDYFGDDDYVCGMNDAQKEIRKKVKNAPAVLPKRSCYRCGLREDCAGSDVKGRPRGEWVNVNISISGDSSAECSLCGAIVHNNFSNVINYCPHCGAKMKGTKDGTR